MKSRRISFISLLLIIVLVFSCSVSKNYKTLSFFFDGVPDPSDSIKREVSLRSIEPVDSLLNLNDSTQELKDKIFYHDPYQYKGCSNCHDSREVGRMISGEPDLCYQCHEDFSEKYKFTHGPVGGGFCTTCHNPHSSKNAHLLKDDNNKLCLYCHNRDELSENEMHNKGEDTQCISCHNPHGGENSLMLFK